MSLPILHSFAGYGVHCIGGGKSSRHPYLFMLYCMVLGNLPDLDFVPGVLAGNASLYHRTFSHSLTACVLIAILGGMAWKRWGGLNFIKAALLTFFAYGSHLVLDLTNTAPKGLQLFWPFSRQTVYGPYVDFTLSIHDHPLELATGFWSFLGALLHPRMVSAFFFECGIVFFVWAVMTALKPSPREWRERESFVFQRTAMTAVCLVFCVLLK